MIFFIALRPFIPDHPEIVDSKKIHVIFIIKQAFSLVQSILP